MADEASQEKARGTAQNQFWPSPALWTDLLRLQGYEAVLDPQWEEKLWRFFPDKTEGSGRIWLTEDSALLALRPVAGQTSRMHFFRRLKAIEVNKRGRRVLRPVWSQSIQNLVEWEAFSKTLPAWKPIESKPEKRRIKGAVPYRDSRQWTWGF